MNFGENLQNLRKKENLSQENLAEKLNVSRQAISKWESNECYPETEKLISICEIFNCSMDTLVKGKIEETSISVKNDYEKIMNSFARGVSLGVFLLLLGTTFLLGIISKDSNSEKYIITGVVVMLIFALFALPIFILRGLEMNNFKEKNKVLENFYKSEEIDNFNSKFSKVLACFISIILLGVIIFLALYGLNIFNGNVIRQVSVLLVFITISVPMIVYYGIQKDKYDINKYNKANKIYSEQNEELLGKISAVIMISATIVYFILGFIWNLWKYNWLVFPICGMICGIFAVILQKEK